MSDDVGKSDNWTPPRLVRWITENFKQRGLPQPHRLEAELLVCHALNISRLDIYLQFEKPCTEQEQLDLRNLVRRRFNREPLAYILENSKFWTLELKVGPGVLVPRQDTELVVETALKLIKSANCDSHPYFVFEFGTGSGAISIALATECSNLVIIAADNSSQALHYAHQNIARYSREIEAKGNQLFLLHCSSFNAFKEHSHFNLIISNPPYIPSDKIDGLQAEVAQWEPKNALDGGHDGLAYYHLLGNAADSFLRQDGSLIIEHGHNQKNLIHDLMNKHNSLTLKDSIKDYAQHDRVLVYQKN